MRNRVRLLFVMMSLSCFVVLLSACKGTTQTTVVETFTPPPTQTESPPPPSPSPTASHTPTATPTITAPPPTETPSPVAYGPSGFPDHVNPLTGLEVASPELLNRRPVAVKINLVPRSSYRPTWGLSLADIVWEYYHNDGYTRLHAIFYGQDAELVGAIRSGRMPDHDLIQMYKSIFAYGSADALVNFRLLNAAYSDRLVMEGQRSNCPPTPERPLCRIEPQGPDLLLTGTKELSQYISNRGVDNTRPNLDGMTFYEFPPQDGLDATRAIVHYSIDSYAQWQFDPQSGQYLLSLDNGLAPSPREETYAPLIDRVTNQQIAAENVVILIVRHQYYQPPPNEIIELLLSGTGKAYALRDGKIYEVVWNRPTIDSVLYLTFPDGAAYPYKPGVTWYQVIGETSKIQEIEAGAWRFDFQFP